MWRRFLLVWGWIAIVIGALVILSSLAPQLWANIDWDLGVCALGLAVASIGICFVSMSR